MDGRDRRHGNCMATHRVTNLLYLGTRSCLIAVTREYSPASTGHPAIFSSRVGIAVAPSTQLTATMALPLEVRLSIPNSLDGLSVLLHDHDQGAKGSCEPTTH